MQILNTHHENTHVHLFQDQQQKSALQVQGRAGDSLGYSVEDSHLRPVLTGCELPLVFVSLHHGEGTEPVTRRTGCESPQSLPLQPLENVSAQASVKENKAEEMADFRLTLSNTEYNQRWDCSRSTHRSTVAHANQGCLWMFSCL